MSISYLKRAAKTSVTDTAAARKVASDVLTAIQSGGEAAIRKYAAELDN